MQLRLAQTETVEHEPAGKQLGKIDPRFDARPLHRRVSGSRDTNTGEPEPGIERLDLYPFHVEAYAVLRSELRDIQHKAEGECHVAREDDEQSARYEPHHQPAESECRVSTTARCAVHLDRGNVRTDAHRSMRRDASRRRHHTPSVRIRRLETIFMRSSNDA